MSFIYKSILSFQHLLVMYTGAVVIPLIIGQALGLSSEDIIFLISADLLTSGIATILYTINTRFIGIGMPVILGASFNSVAAFITIGKSSGLAVVYGAIIVSGIFIFISAPIIGRLAIKLPPIISGIVITVIGLSLIPIAFSNIINLEITDSFLSYAHTSIFLLCLVSIFLLSQFFHPIIKNLSVLISTILFSIIYYQFFSLDLTFVKNTPLFFVPDLFHFGVPRFEISAIITFIIILLVTSVESLGDLNALAEICDEKMDSARLTKSFRSEGLATVIGGFFNAFTYSNFAQNIGLVQMTGNKKISIVQGTAIILIIMSFFPQIAAVTTLIPGPVLGAAMLTMFGMITTAGLRILSRIDFKDDISIWTLALSIGFGVGVANTQEKFLNLPSQIAPFLSNPIVMASIIAIITYYTMTYIKKRG